jgi:hypothetical protein
LLHVDSWASEWLSKPLQHFILQLSCLEELVTIMPLTIQTIQHLSSLESLQKLKLTLSTGQASLAQHLPFPSLESLIIHCLDWAAASTFITAVTPNGSLTTLVFFRNYATIDEYITSILMQMRQGASTL